MSTWDDLPNNYPHAVGVIRDWRTENERLRRELEGLCRASCATCYTDEKCRRAHGGQERSPIMGFARQHARDLRQEATQLRAMGLINLALDREKQADLFEQVADEAGAESESDHQ